MMRRDDGMKGEGREVVRLGFGEDWEVQMEVGEVGRIIGYCNKWQQLEQRQE